MEGRHATTSTSLVHPCSIRLYLRDVCLDARNRQCGIHRHHGGYLVAMGEGFPSLPTQSAARHSTAHRPRSSGLNRGRFRWNESRRWFCCAVPTVRWRAGPMLVWFALIAVSVLVYKCAAANNRRRLLWVGLLWLFSFGSAFVAAVIAVLILRFRGISYATKQQATEAVSAPVHVGELIGAIVCVWLASRPSGGPTPIVGPTETPPVPLEGIPQRIQQDVRGCRRGDSDTLSG